MSRVLVIAALSLGCIALLSMRANADGLPTSSGTVLHDLSWDPAPGWTFCAGNPCVSEAFKDPEFALDSPWIIEAALSGYCPTGTSAGILWIAVPDGGWSLGVWKVEHPELACGERFPATNSVLRHWREAPETVLWGTPWILSWSSFDPVWVDSSIVEGGSGTTDPFDYMNVGPAQLALLVDDEKDRLVCVKRKRRHFGGGGGGAAPLALSAGSYAECFSDASLPALRGWGMATLILTLIGTAAVALWRRGGQVVQGPPFLR